MKTKNSAKTSQTVIQCENWIRKKSFVSTTVEIKNIDKISLLSACVIGADVDYYFINCLEWIHDTQEFLQDVQGSRFRKATYECIYQADVLHYQVPINQW